MQAFDVFWHIANFFAPAVVLGGFAGLATRLIWRRELANATLWQLWAWASGAAALASIGGLVVFQHDGKVATYAAMVLASAAGLWWAAFGRSGR